MTTLEIAFKDEAGDSFDQMINRLEGYTVKVFPEGTGRDQGRGFDAQLVGVDKDAGWHGTLIVRRINPLDRDVLAPAESIVVHRIEVY